MKDPGIELQTKYASLLSDITYGWVSVPFYDVVPLEAEYPHIKVGERTLLDTSNKTSFTMEVTLGLRIIDRFPANYGSRTSVYSISGDIKERIRKITNRMKLTNFNVVTSRVDNETMIEELTDTYFYFRNEIRFRHIIEDVGRGYLTYNGDDILYNGDKIAFKRYA